MKRRILFYPKIALTGIRRNRRTYAPYLLTCVIMVMMYYIFNYLKDSPQVTMMKGGDVLQSMLMMGSWVFTLFAVIFLFYTNSFLIRNRKKEFGLYNILGMDKKNIARILLWECLIMAAVSFGGGLSCGILFSKLAQIWIAYVMNDTADMRFQIETGAIIQTLIIFSVIFVLILLHAFWQVGKSKPVDLLHSAAVGEKPPKANWILALLGAVILAAAYHIAVTIQDPISALLAFFVAVGMVILATYLLFIAGSVVLCRLLQKNKRYYYKANHFISVSSMVYRMKRNGAGLASICILSTSVMVMLACVFCLYIGNEDRLYGRYPRQLEFCAYSFDEAEYQARLDAVNEVLAAHGLTAENEQNWRYLSFGGYFDGDQVILDQNKLDMTQSHAVVTFNSVRDVYFVPLEDYNRLTGRNETLKDNEVLLYAARQSYNYDTITVEGMETRTVKKQVEKFVGNGNEAASIASSLYLIVPDITDIEEADAAQKKVYEKWYSSPRHMYGFDTSADEEEQQALAREIEARFALQAEEGKTFADYRLDSRARERDGFYALYGSMFVLGILLGIIFIAATVLIMYYKQVTEGFEDQARFEIMQKVGMTKRDIRKSIHSQMLTVFFAPLLLAGVHTSFAFPIVRKLLLLFGVINLRLMISVTISCFLVFAVFYTLPNMPSGMPSLRRSCLTAQTIHESSQFIVPFISFLCYTVCENNSILQSTAW